MMFLVLKKAIFDAPEEDYGVIEVEPLLVKVLLPL
jgi:hypothetical protein